MSLPASQRRILEKIEDALRGSDPRLISLFAIFSRLNRGEDMPGIEQLRARASLVLLRMERPRAAARRRLRATKPGGRVAALFVPLALVIVASTCVIAAGLPGSTRCAAVAAAAMGAARHNAKVRTCKASGVDRVFIGK